MFKVPYFLNQVSAGVTLYAESSGAAISATYNRLSKLLLDKFYEEKKNKNSNKGYIKL